MQKPIKIILLLFIFNISVSSAQEYKVVIMLGQSNMVGFGRVSDINSLIQSFPEGVREKITLPPYYIWEDVENGRKESKIWKSLIKHKDASKNIFQFSPNFGGTTPWHGSELGLAYQLKQDRPNVDFALIKIAVGGTNLDSDWRPSASENDFGGFMYRRFKEGFNLAIEQAYEAIVQTQGEEEISIEVVGILWMQGEADAEDNSQAEAYQNNLENFINNVRDVVHNTDKNYIVNNANSPETPFIIGLIMDQQSLDDNCTSPDIPSAIRLPFSDTVRLSQQNVCDSIENCKYFDTKDYHRACGYNSEIHYSTQGLIQMGFDFAKNLNDFYK